jgi:hypothetical protein
MLWRELLTRCCSWIAHSRRGVYWAFSTLHPPRGHNPGAAIWSFAADPVASGSIFLDDIGVLSELESFSTKLGILGLKPGKKAANPASPWYLVQRVQKRTTSQPQPPCRSEIIEFGLSG